MLGAFDTLSVLKSTKANAPESPKAIPIPLISVIFSLRINEAKIKTMTGESVTITELLIGVLRLNPLKKKSMLMHIPKTAQPSILG